jgi:exodeoxyribonuclease-3
MPDGVIDGGDPLRPASPPLRSPRLRLATWNVNSIRTRLDRVLDWLERAEVDVLAMQETKCADDQFPTMPFLELGYEVAHCGFNQWNGVAIASRVGLEQVEVGFDGQPSWSSKPRGDRKRGEAGRSGSPQGDVAAVAEARALAATCAGVQVWSLYVPNGRALGDPHYTYKLNWLAALRDTAESWLRDDPAAQIALVGDLNIAPTDDDVWSVEFFQGATHVSEPERKAFDAIVNTQFADVVRPFTPGPGLYTYWDYTQLRFPKRQGMRIDFILASPALAGRVADAQIVRDERKGKAPSDHAPVLVDLRAD